MRTGISLAIFTSIFLLGCNSASVRFDIDKTENPIEIPNVPFLVILGNVQDAGSPHIACEKKCCEELFSHPDLNRKVVSLGLLDPTNKKKFIFEATPDFPTQMKALKNYGNNSTETPDGIFLTHAHVGHYTGLMYLGKEAMNAEKVPVFAMPRMAEFLINNGPWSQLLLNKNLSLQTLASDSALKLTNNFTITPFLVPHRDEYSETVGYIIEGPNKKALFIPDIDKWEKWDIDIIQAIAKVDYAFIDGTFFDGNEIKNRDMSEIPHPFVIESMNSFKHLSSKEKSKVHFIHFNHTNPLLYKNSAASKQVLKNGFHISRLNDIIIM